MPSVKQLEKLINELEAKRLLKVDEYKELNSLVEKKKTEVLRLEILLREQMIVLKECPDQIREEVSKLEAEKTNLETLLVEKKKELETETSKLADLKAQKVKELSDLAKQKKTLQRGVKDATDALKDLERDIKTSKTAQSKEQAKLDKVKEKYSPLLEDLQKQIKTEEKKLSKLQAESGELIKLKPKLELYYRRIKRYYKQAGLEWFEIKELE